MSTRAYKLIEIKTEKEPTFGSRCPQEVWYLGETDQSNFLLFQKYQVIEAIKETEDEEAKAIYQLILEDMGDDTEVEYFTF